MDQDKEPENAFTNPLLQTLIYLLALSFSCSELVWARTRKARRWKSGWLLCKVERQERDPQGRDWQGSQGTAALISVHTVVWTSPSQ